LLVGVLFFFASETTYLFFFYKRPVPTSLYLLFYGLIFLAKNVLAPVYLSGGYEA